MDNPYCDLGYHYWAWIAHLARFVEAMKRRYAKYKEHYIEINQEYQYGLSLYRDTLYIKASVGKPLDTQAKDTLDNEESLSLLERMR